MAEKLTKYDPAEDLASDQAIATFMAEAFQTNDVAYISHALGVVARAKGMAQIAGQTGLSREQLYRSFSEKGNPTLKTTLAVMKALGIELTAKAASAARSRAVTPLSRASVERMPPLLLCTGRSGFSRSAPCPKQAANSANGSAS